MNCPLLNRRTGFLSLALLLASAASAQTLDQQSPQPDRPKLRQPTPSSVQQPEPPMEVQSRGNSDIDRKLREADRKLSRVMRSICNGC